MKRSDCHLMDLCGVIEQEYANCIHEKIEEAEAATGTEIQVLVVRSIANGRAPKSFATAIFNRWKLGSAKKNNGALILL